MMVLRRSNTRSSTSDSKQTNLMKLVRKSASGMCSSSTGKSTKKGKVDEVVDKYSYAPDPPTMTEQEAAEKYGYGDAVPDYGYGDAAPDCERYRYGDASPDSTKYEYGGTNRHTRSPPARTVSDRTSTTGRRKKKQVDPLLVSDHSYNRRGGGATPRRSSLKQQSSYGADAATGTNKPVRRSSITFKGEREITLPNSNRKVKRRTSISFNEDMEVKTVEPVSELVDNPEQLWFQDKDFAQMRDKCMKIIDVMKSGELPPEQAKKLCVRGLEHYVEKTSKQRKEEQNTAWDSVLDIQDVQMDYGVFDAAQMALSYRLQSMESSRQAALRALKDAEAVTNYLSSTRHTCRRLSC